MADTKLNTELNVLKQVFSFDIEELNQELQGEASDEKRFPGNECPECGWETSELYVYAETLETAHKLIVDGKAGKCGRCFAEMLVNQEIQII
jgi:predicted PP-loop superfamily ATPase